jgi:dienelactone hydrolase
MRVLTALFLSLFLMTSLPARANDTAFKGRDVSYHDGGAALQGYWADAQNLPGRDHKPAPLVMIVHQWRGLGSYEKGRADQLAALGYNAFAVDMYGKGVRPADDKAAGAEAGKYKNDPALARRRITAALDFARAQPGIDPGRIVVIGYCFGGAMALELARSGADIRGVVTFHGDLTTNAPVTKPGIIKARIEVHHGADDPHVTQKAVANFIGEMKTADADWTLTQYAHAVHAFTQKDAGDDPSKGVAYNAEADRESWAALLMFLKDVLG